MTKLIILLLTVISVSVFAVDFSYGMSAADAKEYILENVGNANKINDCSTAKAIVYISEHQDTVTYQNIVDAIGDEYALQTVYQIALSVPKSEYCVICNNLLIDKLQDNESIKNLNYYKDIIISANLNMHKTHPDTNIYSILTNKHSIEEIRLIISSTLIKYIDLGLTDEYNKNIDYVLCNCIKSYQAIYLDCDEEVVKADLKKLNAKAFLLLDVSEEYKTFVTRLRMLYKSLDF